MKISGKCALVTGGTDGIGLEIARQLKQRGATVIVVGRNPERLQSANDEGFQELRADLSDTHGCAALLGALDRSSVDILVNNAGSDPAYKFDQPVDLPAIDRAIFLNLNAPVHLIAGLIGSLRARPCAAIVNVTSGLAIAPAAETPVYCATKAGLRSFTQALRAQLKDTNVSVIEALPPMVDTQMTSAISKSGKMPAATCAAAIVKAIEHDDDEANIGEVKLLRRIYSLSPALARRIMLNS